MNLIKFELSERFVCKDPSFFRWTIMSLCIWHLRKEQLTVVFSTLCSLWIEVTDWLVCDVEKQYVGNRINRTFSFLFCCCSHSILKWTQSKMKWKKSFYFHINNAKITLNTDCMSCPLLSSQPQCNVYKESEENKNINNQTTAGYWFKHINNYEVNCG